jgi:hypothetical protein
MAVRLHVLAQISQKGSSLALGQPLHASQFHAPTSAGATVWLPFRYTCQQRAAHLLPSRPLAKFTPTLPEVLS